ncbi:hypothetical protein [Nocardia sp. NPDC051832]|uniref:hypothetical protein n=1 Tax=Nocardia sp. NPDC051832 TaxID=3155673 RepID=UPI003414E7EA
MIVPSRPTDPEDLNPIEISNSPAEPELPGHHHGGSRHLLDVLVLLAIIASMLVLVVVAEAGPQILGAASAFIIAIFGLWLKYRR